MNIHRVSLSIGRTHYVVNASDDRERRAKRERSANAKISAYARDVPSVP